MCVFEIFFSQYFELNIHCVFPKQYSGYKTPTREDLIYFEESPDFCVPNHKYGVMGTQGRTCNASSIGVEGL